MLIIAVLVISDKVHLKTYLYEQWCVDLNERHLCNDKHPVVPVYLR